MSSSLSQFSRSLFETSDDQTFGESTDNQPQTGSPGSSPTKTLSSPNAFAKELSRLQDEHVQFIRKIDREKARKMELETDIEDIRNKLSKIQEKTKSGNIVMDHEITNKKLISRLEHQLQMSNIKLSTAKNENITLKGKVQDLRREKLLQLQILNDLLKEAGSAKRRIKFCQREVGVINDKKHKVKVSITNTKQRMIKDMEEFSNEISQAKQNISKTQMNIMGTIREKLQNTYADSPTQFTTLRAHTAPPQSSDNAKRAKETHQTVSNLPLTSQEIESVLKDTEFGSVEDLLVALQSSEETVFNLYNETQSRHEEVEKMELENKHLETQVQEQMKKLHVLEGNQEQVKQELEKNIQNLKSQIEKYQSDYNKNMDILAGISDTLLNILKNVAIDEEALDQQLLSTGLTDRNVDEFLGLIEQRIDELIQMSKAANKQVIRRDDFLKMAASDKKGLFQYPDLPTIFDANDEDDDYYYSNNAAANNNNTMLGNGISNNPEEGLKIQPVNIPILKELMMKRLQKMNLLNGQNAGNGNNNRNKFDKNAFFYNQNLRGQTSSSSLKSVESSKSLRDF